MSTLTALEGTEALQTYETFAPFYDRYTADHGHESWMADVDAILRGHGIPGPRLLDVACGTGKSFVPLLRRGYRVTGCDASPGMAERAREKLGDRGEVRVADMRALPWREAFDVATCVDDGINYLLSFADVVAALRSIRAALVPGGVLVFDVNALGLYRGAFAEETTFEAGGLTFRWRGVSSPTLAPGELVTAFTDVIGADGSTLVTARHVQRHYGKTELRLACAEAGLDGIRFWGEIPGEGLVPDAGELVSSKTLCLAVRPPDAG